MNIAILSRGPQLYSTQSLYRAGIKRGHSMQVIDHLRCNMLLEKHRAEVYFNNMPLDYLDAIVPRIGSSVTFAGSTLINHFEMMGVATSATSSALQQCRNKLQCLQKLSRYGLDVPKTAFINPGQDLFPLIEQLGGFPVVIKLLEGTHGVGVLLSETLQSAEATIEAFQKLKEKVILQEFIQEASGSDVRVIVVGGEVIAAMKRQAKEGEFRSNLHRGAQSEIVELSPEEEHVAVKSARIMGLNVAGVDLLRSARGPLVMEVNASPGLEGIEMTTGVDVAGAIISFMEKQVRKGSKMNRKIRR